MDMVVGPIHNFGIDPPYNFGHDRFQINNINLTSLGAQIMEIPTINADDEFTV